MTNNIFEKEILLMKSNLLTEQHLMINDPKKWLLTAPVEIIDERSISSERIFKLRFGFTAPEEQRQHYIYLRKQFDFTDQEITSLEYTKAIKFENGKISIIESDFILNKIGYVAIPILTLLALTALLIAITQHPATLYNLSTLALVTALFALSIWHTYKTTMVPTRILKSRGIYPGSVLKLHKKSFIIESKKNAGQSSNEQDYTSLPIPNEEKLEVKVTHKKAIVLPFRPRNTP